MSESDLRDEFNLLRERCEHAEARAERAERVARAAKKLRHVGFGETTVQQEFHRALDAWEYGWRPLDPGASDDERKGDSTMTGVELIAAERQRQIDVEGFDAYHDEEHDYHDMTDAAICYSLMSEWQQSEGFDEVEITARWPWDIEWWKPSDDPVRNLVKAGALIAAEIDRLSRDPA